MDALLVDDDPQALERATLLFESAGFRVEKASNAEEALSKLEAHDYKVVLSDHWLPGTTGLELIQRLKKLPHAPPVILASAQCTTSSVAQAMQAGAAYYVEKPLLAEELTRGVQAALGTDSLPGSFESIEAQAAPQDPIPELVGVSTCIRNVKQLIQAAARTTSPVFIHGATGTGKEVVARAIHRLSDRSKKPFIAVNCGALPDGLAESELFGAEKGAFTGAGAAREGLVRAASGGTLFLDELGEMPMNLQVKLLRVLQEQAVRSVGGTQEEPVDIRVIAATNRTPEKAVEDGKLREDLYFRLVVLRIDLSPLKSRPEDLGPLCSWILSQLRERYGHGPETVSGAALEALRRYSWPGNVRELVNVLDLVFALGAAKQTIELKHLPDRIQAANPEGKEPETETPESPTSSEDIPLMALREAELQMIRQALQTSGGNKAKAARLLGISRQALYRRLEDLDVDPKQ